MDKNVIKKYAVWARTELIDRVRQRAEKYEITVDANPGADSASGKVLTPVEKTQRQAAIARMRDKGYEYVIEEVAYTWFNRFAAMRYMEVNNYLPIRVRVFTDDSGSFKPQILTEAIHLKLDGLDMEKVYELKQNEESEELYKYLIITQCNALSAVLPLMFKPVDEKCKLEKDDYTILLFPDKLLREGSVVEQMVSMISEDNWQDAVQIIGWMYQYYNDDRKNEVININKGTVKKEDIPAATQLFTTDWVVRYIVDNSVGRYWIERNPKSTLQKELEYYVPSKSKEICTIQEQLKPEELTVLDPCMGSAHFLVYVFDVLMKIYQEYGYSNREAVQSIIENNLYGLDIDDRATQLAYFSVMMKAMQYDNRFLRRSQIPQPYIYSIKESNKLDSYAVDYFCNGDVHLTEAMQTLIENMHDASEYGSIITVPNVDFSALYVRFDEIKRDISMYKEIVLNELLPFIKAAELLAKKYAVVDTNPPYLNKMDTKLKKYVADNFKDYSGDLFSVFMYRNLDFCKVNGYAGFMTPFVWMFIKTYEKLRNYILSKKAIVSLIQMEYSAFEEATVPICSFILKNGKNQDKGVYFKLSEFKGGMDVQKEKVLDALSDSKCDYIYEISENEFFAIPGAPIAYWVSTKFSDAFRLPSIKDVAHSCIGMRTGDNDRFLRYWYEVSIRRIGFDFSSAEEVKKSKAKWIPFHKGGDFRRWYGNNDYVVNWENDGVEIKENTRKVYPQLGDNLNWKITNEKYYFYEGITWTAVSSAKTGFRRYPVGFIFSNAGQAVISNGQSDLDYLTGLLNCKVIINILQMIAPTVRFESGEIGKIPVCYDVSQRDYVVTHVNQAIAISKEDWDSLETSWDFQHHLLLPMRKTETDKMYYLDKLYDMWANLCEERVNRLKASEEKLNRIFIDIYGLQEELTPEVEDKDVTVCRADFQRDIKSLISYAVGCMLGRYSLDKDGLAYAGGEWEISKYQTFPADKDNVIPICDDEYFEDDITGLFIKFIETVYGKDTLDENLRFIADALGGKGTLKEVIRNYFLNDFFTDHCKMYQKRPIYWLFDSGKKNGFKALVYMHRYQPDTIARMRTDYVHEQQSRYRTAIADLENRIAGASTSERVRLNKQLSKLKDQSEEIHIYEEKIHHLADRMIAIDLDDGVKKNYEIFKDVLAKIK